MNAKPALLTLVAFAASATGGWLVGHSGRESSDHARESPGTSENSQRNGSETSAQATNASAQSRRESLRRLLEAARQQMLGDSTDMSGKIRAAARISLIDPADLPASLELLATFDGGLYRNREFAALLLERWASFDGAAACDFALARMKNPMMGLHPVGNPLRAWASVDPSAAMAWFQTRKTPAGGVNGADSPFGDWAPISDIRWIVGAWAMRDANEAAQVYRDLASDGERNGARIGLREAAAGAPGRTALLDALWETENKTIGGSRSDQVWGVLDEWSAHNPAELAAWIDTKETRKSNDYLVCKAVLGSWLLDDQTAAIDWWMKREGGHPGASSKLGNLISAWAPVDVIGASEWLADQELTEDHTRAVTGLCQQLNREDPEKAFAWAQAVPSERSRKSAIKSSYQAWFKKAPEAALSALEAADIDEQLRASLLAPEEAKQGTIESGRRRGFR